MAKKKARPDAVVCYWEWNPSGSNVRPWKLAESFAMDEDGHPLSPATGDDEREPWVAWLCRKSHDGYEDPDDFDWEHIPGRAATIWTFGDGVRLLGFNPPENADWLSVFFIDKISETPGWPGIIEGGYAMRDGTVEAAKRIIFPRGKP
jgi:hypothetical protein